MIRENRHKPENLPKGWLFHGAVRVVVTVEEAIFEQIKSRAEAAGCSWAQEVRNLIDIGLLVAEADETE